MKKLRMPHIYVILAVLLLFAALMTYALPSGSFERYEDAATGRTLVAAGSYQVAPSSPVGLMGLLQAIPKGMEEAANLIVMIFIFGGAFGIIFASGAIESGIQHSIHGLRRRAALILPVILVVFAMLGAFMGLLESLVAFLPVSVMLCRALGYDAITAFALQMVGSFVGFAAGPACMWNTGVAQSIAELPLFSAMGVRVAMLAVLLAISAAYIMCYAHRVRKNPAASIVYEQEQKHRERAMASDVAVCAFTTRKKVVLISIVASFVGLLLGVLFLDWGDGYQVAGYVLGVSVLIGLIDGQSADEIAENFVAGAREITMAALVVGFARAILTVLTEGQVVDTILYGASNLLGGFSPVIAILLMFFFQYLFNFVIYASSVQAATTMPLMVPLADLAGLTRQSAVIAFQLGDGISALLWPTAGPLMAGLALTKIPYIKWLRWVWPLLLMLTAACAGICVLCALLPVGPF